MIKFVCNVDPDHPELKNEITMGVYFHEDMTKEIIIAVETSSFPLRSQNEVDALIMELQELREKLPE